MAAMFPAQSIDSIGAQFEESAFVCAVKIVGRSGRTSRTVAARPWLGVRPRQWLDHRQRAVGLVHILEKMPVHHRNAAELDLAYYQSLLLTQRPNALAAPVNASILRICVLKLVFGRQRLQAHMFERVETKRSLVIGQNWRSAGGRQGGLSAQSCMRACAALDLGPRDNRGGCRTRPHQPLAKPAAATSASSSMSRWSNDSLQIRVRFSASHHCSW